MHADKLSRQRGQLIDVLRPLPFDDDVGAFDVAEVTQARPQPLTCGTLEGKTKKPDGPQLRRLLRARRERPRSRTAAECDQQFPPSDGDCHTPLPCEVRRGNDTTPRACCPNSAA